MTPKGLTTKGKAREIAKANYELEGIELKKAVAMIECDTDEDKAKVYFIHFNHSNPLLNHKSNQYKMVIGSGFNIAQVGQVLAL